MWTRGVDSTKLSKQECVHTRKGLALQHGWNAGDANPPGQSRRSDLRTAAPVFFTQGIVTVAKKPKRSCFSTPSMDRQHCVASYTAQLRMLHTHTGCASITNRVKCGIVESPDASGQEASTASQKHGVVYIGEESIVQLQNKYKHDKQRACVLSV